jgi:adenylate kinase
MIVILLGAPGSGKGTQSKVLASCYGFEHLSTGDILRSEMAAKTSLGEKTAKYVDAGKLVPDNIMTEMVAGRLEAGRNYLLDGFPRTLQQAQELPKMLEKQKVDLVIFLNLPEEEAIKRITSRRVCVKCGEVFNVVSRLPKVQGKCDKCGGALEQRKDDAESTAKDRLRVFNDLTHPLIAYYKAEQIFQEVDAAKAPDQVTSDLRKVIDSAMAVR